jgi:hypothetical protein
VDAKKSGARLFVLPVARNKVCGLSPYYYGNVSKNPNAKRIDPKTGKEISFNMLDEMEPYNEAAFK